MKNRILFLLVLFLLLFMCSCSVDEDDIDLRILDMTEKIMIAQWNIGHLNGGGREDVSNISPDIFEYAKSEYTSFLYSVPASIISINEYTTIFATDKNGQSHTTADLLFGDYGYNYIGPYNYGPANALFSKFPISSVREIYYQCNESAQITHDSYLKAKWYYIIELKAVINGHNTIVVSTHLAFDLNNEDVARNQIKEIIERYRYEDYVILCGDWNVMDISSYDLFSQAGYQLANHGEYGDYYTCSNYLLDNIVVKGFNIDKTYMKKTFLSDHNMIVAILSFK